MSLTDTARESAAADAAAAGAGGPGTGAGPANAAEALSAVRAGLDYLAAADPTELAARLTSGPGLAERAARQLTIAQAVRLLSGPTGLTAWLRTRQQTGLAGSVSLPLDIGTGTDTIPTHLRRAVARRDQHCRFPGCEQPPAACHVHHLIPRSEGGPTSLANCTLLCAFHHLVAIHRWGWTLTLNPDGTTVATSPDGQRTLHSHAPPTAA